MLTLRPAMARRRANADLTIHSNSPHWPPADASCSSAACTPPGRCGTPRHAEAHLHRPQRARQHQIVEVAEMADAEYAALELAEAVAERHVEALQDHAPQLVRVVPRRHQHGGERAAVLARIGAQDLQAPGLDRARVVASP